MDQPIVQIPNSLTVGRRAGFARVPMPLDQLQIYNPNRADAIEAVWQPFYHFQTYALAGTTTAYTFFQVPYGQAAGGYADTNMLLAGQFPSPTSFFCTGIMVVFIPGNVVSATAATGVALQNWNDVVKIANTGFLQLTVGNKPYLYDAPLGKFPPNFSVGGNAAISNGVFQTANISTYLDYARASGKYYEITPLLIPQTQNFNVTLNFPTTAAVTTNGRLGVILDGFFYRQSQ